MVMNLTKTLLKNIDNKEIISYNVRFDNGFEVEILNLGGIITKIITPDKNGNLENIVVGYKDIFPSQILPEVLPIIAPK